MQVEGSRVLLAAIVAARTKAARVESRVGRRLSQTTPRKQWHTNVVPSEFLTLFGSKSTAQHEATDPISWLDKRVITYRGGFSPEGPLSVKESGCI